MWLPEELVILIIEFLGNVYYCHYQFEFDIIDLFKIKISKNYEKKYINFMIYGNFEIKNCDFYISNETERLDILGEFCNSKFFIPKKIKYIYIASQTIFYNTVFNISPSKNIFCSPKMIDLSSSKIKKSKRKILKYQGIIWSFRVTVGANTNRICIV